MHYLEVHHFEVCWSQIWTSISCLFCLSRETLFLYSYKLHLWKLVFKIMLMNMTICLGLTLPWLVDFIYEPPRSHTFSPNSFISAPQLDHGSFGANSILCLALCLHCFFFHCLLELLSVFSAFTLAHTPFCYVWEIILFTLKQWKS